MISIERISFDFVMDDERFAQKLYADWDRFCRVCVENVLEECLFDYDRDSVLYAIDKMELDLENIPQDSFYEEFPKRLKEAIKKALPSLQITTGADADRLTYKSRLENLIHYLRYGNLLAVWADMDFNLSTELVELIRLDRQNLERVTELCISDEYVLMRLLLQTDSPEALKLLYAKAMERSFSVKDGKRRFMNLFLEMQPEVVLGFVHQTQVEEHLQGMADLLETNSVNRLMVNETKEHAEVDLPPFWHYLYEWLIKYYPYNGVAIFGGKGDFIAHLHYRLLTYIRKRNYTFYLSKTELTASFLLEVFGAAYYREVLNAIYQMQERNTDGSPAYDGYYNIQLYRVFMQLSLLTMPSAVNERHDSKDFRETESGEQGRMLKTDWVLLTTIIKDNARQDADKRMMLSSIILREPEAFVIWLRTMADDSHLITMLAMLMNEHLLKQLLAVASLEAMECVDEVIRFLASFINENELPYQWTSLDASTALRKVVLMWISNKENKSSDKSVMESLLVLIQRELAETANMENIPTIDKWIEAYHLRVNDTPDNQVEDIDALLSQEEHTLAELIVRLQKRLTTNTLSERIKRRLVVTLLEQYRANTTDVIKALYEQGVLDCVMNYIDASVAVVIIRRIIQMTIHAEQTDKFIACIEQLLSCENAVRVYLSNKDTSLKAQILVGITKAIKDQLGLDAQTANTSAVLFSMLLITLFSKENVPQVVGLISKKPAGDSYRWYESSTAVLTVEEWDAITSRVPVSHYLSIMEQWSVQMREQSRIIQTWLKNGWQTTVGFTAWLEDSKVSITSKREMLQALVTHHPQELIVILRREPRNNNTISLISTYLPVETLLDGLEKVDSKGIYLLTKTIDLLEKEQSQFAFLSTMNLSFSSALSQALLLFMQDESALVSSNLTQERIIAKFLEHLYFVYTQKTDYKDHAEWKKLQVFVASEFGINDTSSSSVVTSMALSEEEQLEQLRTECSQFSDSRLYVYTLQLLEYHMEVLIKLVEQDKEAAIVGRLIHIADKDLLKRMVKAMGVSAGFGNGTAFMQWMDWLIAEGTDSIKLTALARVLFLWVGSTDWKRQSQNEIIAFFVSHLDGFSFHNSISFEMLTDDSLPEDVQKGILRMYMGSRPLELVNFLHEQYSKDRHKLQKWVQWTKLSEWLQVASSLSLTLGELLKQVVDYLLSQNKWVKSEFVLKYAMIQYLSRINMATIAYLVDKKDVVRSFIFNLSDIQNIAEKEKNDVATIIIKELDLNYKEDTMKENDESGMILIDNAGLCLFAPWFPRLFAMLGYLDEDKRDFKDIASKLRAVFLIQYFICPQEKDFRESELAFNRLLVSLPPQIPLPKRMELTNEEKQTANDMMEGVKANWVKMRGTSIEGFRRTFLIRNGQLEHQDERWLLTVEDKVYDILLDTIPWGFRQIRFPWMKKYIQVSWHEKQEF